MQPCAPASFRLRGRAARRVEAADPARGLMAWVKVLSWRGIPMSVKVRDESGRRASRPMPDWFGQEVDRVAMREGLAGSDDYLEQLEWSDEVEHRSPLESFCHRPELGLAPAGVVERRGPGHRAGFGSTSSPRATSSR